MAIRFPLCVKRASWEKKIQTNQLILSHITANYVHHFKLQMLFQKQLRFTYPHPHLNSPSQYTPKASRITAKIALRDLINIWQKIKSEFKLYKGNEIREQETAESNKKKFKVMVNIHTEQFQI